MPNPFLDLSGGGAGQEGLTADPNGGYRDSNGVWWPNLPGSHSGASPNIQTDANGNVTINGQPYTNISGGGPGATYVGTNPQTQAQKEATLSPQSRDALAILKSTLDRYGLGSLLGWVTDKLIDGASDDTIKLELYDRAEFKARFPVINARRERGLNPMTPEEVLQYETRASELFRAAGLNALQTGAPPYAQSLLQHDVSLAELGQRIDDAYLRVQQAPQEVKDAFSTYYGALGDQNLAMYILDPDKALPELEKQAMTAFTGGIGKRFGVTLAMQTARDVANTGVDESAIWQGFRNLDQMKPLFEETLGEGVDLKSEVQGVQAVFGTQPGAAAVVEQRRATRAAEMSGGGGAAAAESGVYGLGVADR